MSTHNICFHGEIRKISTLFGCEKVFYLELCIRFFKIQILYQRIVKDLTRLFGWCTAGSHRGTNPVFLSHHTDK